MDREFVYKALDKFTDQILQGAKIKLQRISASGKLADSLDKEINVTENAIEVLIKGESYAKFIDKGVKGVESGTSLEGYAYKRKGGKRGLKGMPPPSAFDKWNIIRGRSSRDEKGRFLPRKSLNFATAVSVFKHGIRPTRFLTDPFEDAFKELPDDLVDAYGLEIESFMKQVLNTDDGTRQ